MKPLMRWKRLVCGSCIFTNQNARYLLCQLTSSKINCCIIISIISVVDSSWLAVQRNVNVLVSINVVTLSWARLVPGWVTIFEWINYLGF